jgi:predicted ATPase/DNA-binding winged helix-turn-helix (wHTH) protein
MDHTQDYLFGPFRLIPRRLELWCGDVSVPLGSRGIELLWALVEANGTLVTKQALLARVWPGQIHDDTSVWSAVKAVRKALAAGLDSEPYIVSVTGRGYRFAAPVTRAEPDEPAPEPPAIAVPLVSEAAPGNLPLVIAPLIGRDVEIARCLMLLERSRLLTLAGIGGVGKTRMALALGDASRHRHADGVWLVELAALTTPELVPEAIAALLGLSVQGSRTAIQVVAAYLRQKDALLILDNCEHIVTEVAHVAEAILQNCARVKILATSREPLRVSGEQTYRLPSLGLPDPSARITAAQALDHAAIRLFAIRAGLAVEGFVLTDDVAPVVVDICWRLDGIPLAIELAAACLRMLNPRELLDRLDRRFALLSDGSRTVQPRHQTLTALIDWSWDLLLDGERELFARLATFGGSFTLDSAEAVAGTAPLAASDILGLLTALVDKSMVTVGAGRAGTRYRMLETTRGYALDRLAPGPAAACRRLLAGHLAAALEVGMQDYQRVPTAAWLDAWLPELDNLRVALDWAFGHAGEPALGVRLVAGAMEIWYEASLIPEMRRAVERAKAALTPDTPPAIAARILLGGAGAVAPAPGIRSTEADGRRALDLARSSGDAILLGRVLILFGGVLFNPADPAEGLRFSLEAIALLQPLGPTKALAGAHLAHGVSLHLGGTGDPRPDYHRATEIGRRVGDHRRVNIAAQHLAEYTFMLGDHEAAVAAARDAVASAHALGMRVQIAFCELNLGGYLLVAGAGMEGAAHARVALNTFASMGMAMHSGIALQHLALALAHAGDSRNAARLLGAAEAAFLRDGYVREPTERVAYDLLSAAIDRDLGVEDRDRLLAEGAALDIEAAAALAAELGV